MPTLPASGYAVPVAPSVEPLATPATPYQQISGATAEAFGAGTGEALSRLGGQFEQAAGRFENIQSFYDQVAADEQVNSFEDRLNRILYGDPDKPGDVGYMGLQGRNALDARAATRKAIDDQILSQRANITSLRQQHLFDQQTRRYRNYALSAIGRHYDSQFNKYAAETAKSTAELAINRGDVAANNNDFGGWKEALGSALNGVADAGKADGLDSATIEIRQKNLTKHMAVNWAKVQIQKNPVEAKRFIEENKDHLGDQYDNLLGQVEAKARDMQADEILAGRRPQARSNLIRGGALQGDAGDKIAATLRTRGWTDAAIAAALNNAMTESSLNPNSKGAAGERGLFQFHPASHIRPFESRYGGDWSAEAQTNYMADVVEATMPGFKDMQDSQQATTQFMRGFEKPKDQSDIHAARRYGNENAARAIIQRASVQSPVTPVIAEGAKPADQLISNLPSIPLDPGELPDAEVPGLLPFLQERAKLVPPDADPKLWMSVVKKARTLYNARYAGIMQQERLSALAQQKADREESDKYIQRMYRPGEVPTEAEISANTRMSVDARKSTIGFLRSTARPDPSPQVSSNNQLEGLRRIGLPDTDQDAITHERQIREMANNKLITFDHYQELIGEFRGMENTREADRRREMSRLVTAAQGIINPMRNFVTPTGADAAREAAYAHFVEQKVRENKEDPKALRRLFDPSPDNKEFLGHPEIVREFLPSGREGKRIIEMFNRTTAATKLEDMNFKTVEEVNAAWKAGKFGPVNDPISRQRAIDFSLSKGFIRPSEPQVQVPVR